MKRLIIAFAIAALPFAAQADDGQTVTVGGVAVNKIVKEITFNGSDVNSLLPTVPHNQLIWLL